MVQNDRELQVTQRLSFRLLTSSFFKRVAVPLALIVLSQGCAHNNPNDVLSLQTKAAITVTPQTGQHMLNIPAKGRLSESGRGAKKGSLLGALGVYCYWGAPICIPALGALGAIGGSIYGAAAADSEPEWKKREAVLSKAIDDSNMGFFLLNSIKTYAKSNQLEIEIPAQHNDIRQTSEAYNSELYREGYKTRIDITDVMVSLVPGGSVFDEENLLKLKITAKTRTLITENSDEIKAISISYETKSRHTIETWIADDATLFKKDLTNAINGLAENIVTDLFLLYDLHDWTPIGLIYSAYITGLKPIWPPLKGELRLKEPFVVRTLQPTLRWSPLPFVAENLAYDLKIWTAQGDNPGELVYFKKNITTTSHTIETELLHGTRYYWSVRATFILNKIKRATEWSKHSIKPNEIFTILTLGTAHIGPYPADNTYYDFVTQ